MEIDRFPGLSDLPGVQHAFTTRHSSNRPARHGDDETLLQRLGMDVSQWRRGHQVHGRRIAVVTRHSDAVESETDGLCTDEPGLGLVISVADCCAVFVADPQRRAIGLAHSGRKGTELRILSALLETMRDAFGCRQQDLVVQLSPCIRPPHYEIDFAAEIRRQAAEFGTGSTFDCGVCTAQRIDRYYSYRAEKGDTGRMAAVLALDP